MAAVGIFRVVIDAITYNCMWLLCIRIPIRHVQKDGLGMLAKCQVSNVVAVIVSTEEHVSKP
jgi:hypothetical protein